MEASSALFEYYQRFLPALPLVLMIGAIIIGFDCIWRVEKRLDTFMKLLTVGMIFNAIRKLVVVFGYTDFTPLLSYTQYLDVAANGFFFAAFVEMYRIIRVLTHEEKDTSQK